MPGIVDAARRQADDTTHAGDCERIIFAAVRFKVLLAPLARLGCIITHSPNAAATSSRKYLLLESKWKGHAMKVVYRHYTPTPKYPPAVSASVGGGLKYRHRHCAAGNEYLISGGVRSRLNCDGI